MHLLLCRCINIDMYIFGQLNREGDPSRFTELGTPSAFEVGRGGVSVLFKISNF